MVSSSIRLTAWLQNSKKRAERSEVDVWQSHPRLSPLWLSASSSACHGLLIITVITPYIKAQRDKNARELKLANAAITDMQMRQRDVAALDAKYTKELADAKAEKMMLCVMMLPLVVVGCTSKQSVSQCVKPPPPPAWIMQPPRLADTAEQDYLHSEAVTVPKTTGRNPSILWAVQIELPISMGNSCNYCEQYTRASSGV